MAMLTLSSEPTSPISSPFFNAGFATPPDESICTSPFSDIKTEQRFWTRLNKRAKSLLLDKDCSITPDSSPLPVNTNEFCSREQGNPQQDEFVEASTCTKKVCREDSRLLQKGLEAVASSLCQLSQTLGAAVEEGTTLGETKLSDLLPVDPEKADLSTPKIQRSPEKAEEKPCEEPNSKVSASASKLKDSRNTAMAMACKARSLQRELKSVRTDLCFMRERCAFLEEENRRLRDGAKGVRPEEDDLVRLQLEALLAEKARLAQENANFVRENQYLHQLVEYHQLTLQDVAVLDDSFIPMCLDFSSPSPSPSPSPRQMMKRERENEDEDPQTPIHNIVSFSSPLTHYDDDEGNGV